MSILQRLYDSEINFQVSGFYDARKPTRRLDKAHRWAVCTVPDRR
jgi:hypothetical protein